MGEGISSSYGFVISVIYLKVTSFLVLARVCELEASFVHAVQGMLMAVRLCFSGRLSQRCI